MYKRTIIDKLLKYIDTKQCLVIYGSRQVGKTTALKYIMEYYLKENVFYFDMEMQSLLELCNKGVDEVYAYLLQKGADKNKKIYLIIDEVQYIQNPTNFIKICHDHYPQIKLLVSGSSTFEIKKKFKESLVGRTIVFELYGLTFEEFLTFKNKKYALHKENVTTINKELIPLAEEYIKYGAYPQIVLEENEEKKQTYLWQIINTYVRKDIQDIGKVRNVTGFNKLLQLLASQSGQILNVLEIANTLDLGRETVLEYIQLLENTFIIKKVSPFHKNLRSELSKSPKVFLLDTGMLHLLWLKEFPKNILGNVFETFIYLELMKAEKEIYFWRTKQKQEIDFIVDAKSLFAIEAKYQFKDKKRTHLPIFEKQYPCKTVVVALKGEKTVSGDKSSQLYPWELIKQLE